MDAEQKLAAYRAKKQRQEQLNQVTHSIHSFYKKIRQRMIAVNVDDHDNNDVPLLTEKEDPEISDTESEVECCVPTYITVITYILYLILWFTLLIIFVKLEFGLVYIVASALVGIYFNTRTSKKKKNEISAYSVFNMNCESIDGTLKAEQFEREIRMGPISVR